MILHPHKRTVDYFRRNCPECSVSIVGERDYDEFVAAIATHRRQHENEAALSLAQRRLDALAATGRVNAITDHGTVPAHTSSSYTRLEGVVGYTLSY